MEWFTKEEKQILKQKVPEFNMSYIMSIEEEEKLFNKIVLGKKE